MSEVVTELGVKTEEQAVERDKNEITEAVGSDAEKKKIKSNHNNKKHHSKRQQHKRWKKGGKFKRRKNHKENKADQNATNDGQPSCNQNRKHTKPSYNHVAVQRNKRLQQAFATVSKFFLPDKLPRKARVIPPTKFLLGGNISDPLNLNSLQNESENAVTPKSSPVQTTPNRQPVEVLIPPNIHDPLHLLDPVDSVEYEMQLCSPMKNTGKHKNRHRKRRKSCRSIVGDANSSANTASGQTDQETGETENSRATPSIMEGDVPSTSNVTEPERMVKNLRLELSQAGTGRKRNNSESSNSGKSKQRRVDMDKIVSPVIPQTYPVWKRPHKNTSKPGRNRTRSYSRSISEEHAKPTSSDTSVKQEQCEKNLESKPSGPEGGSTETNQIVNRNKNSKYQYGNYDRYYGYRHLNEYMDVRLKVFKKNPSLFKDKDVLDIGCNVGLLTIWVGKSLQPKSIVGVDIDKKLIYRARKNLSAYVRIPNDHNNSNASLGQTGDDPVPGTSKDMPRKRRYSRRYSRQNSKYRKQANTQDDAKFFPMSFPLCLGRIPVIDSSPPTEVGENTNHHEFPENVFFRTFNYVPKDENQLTNETQQYDLIMCLSVTKWIHLNFGDAGLKMAFKRMFNQLRPGGKLILEAQNWASYKKKKNFSETIKTNYKTIRFFPKKFNEYLLSSEVGFSHSYPLGIPRHLSKGFSRPIQLYVKGDFTPGHAEWSDYHISQTPYQTPKSDKQKNKYYTNLLIGNSTPYASHGNYSYRMTDPSPYYNPFATDSYLPSYDNETTRRTYCFASPLYSTTWSPPATDSRPGSLTSTPAGGSVRNAEMDEGYSNSRPHVYPPCSDEFDEGKSSTRSLDSEDVSPSAQHVYSEAVLSDEKDDSRSPKTNMEYQEPIHVAEQINVAAIAEQNGVVVNHVNHVNHIDQVPREYEDQNHREEDLES